MINKAVMAYSVVAVATLSCSADVRESADNTVQSETESALKWGIAEYGAGAGWSIVMDSATGEVLAMASEPNDEKLERVVSFDYEPGSVMKAITVAAAIDAGFTSPESLYSTNRDDPRYYKLPGDGPHKWEENMSVKEAVARSSNIVIGKLSYDLGPLRLYDYMKEFGFGERTGINLPNEQCGRLPDPNHLMWDKATWSRAGIGQFVSVTAIQLASAYQAIANDGLRMRPYVGEEVEGFAPTPLGRPISAETAKAMREILLDVVSTNGTARSAAIPGYSVAGKTGTAQKLLSGGKGYAPGLYRATFCGMVPASKPRLVVVVTLDFDKQARYHQGGNSAAPVFRRIATAALKQLKIAPDRP